MTTTTPEILDILERGIAELRRRHEVENAVGRNAAKDRDTCVAVLNSWTVILNPTTPLAKWLSEAMMDPAFHAAVVRLRTEHPIPDWRG